MYVFQYIYIYILILKIKNILKTIQNELFVENDIFAMFDICHWYYIQMFLK